MIATTPESKPIECTPEEELLVNAYSVLRQVKHYFAQLEPSHSLRADTQTAVRDFCLAFRVESAQATQITGTHAGDCRLA